MTTLRERLATIGDNMRERFDAERRVLSFNEYLELFAEHPYRHSRDASRFMRDCFDHFGAYDVKRPYGTLRRYRVFDADPTPSDAAGARREYLVGHEHVQDAFYRILSNFVREGRHNRLTLLHGPNGSAKSTFASCIMKALERYSQTDEGALYTFSWVFPRGTDGKPIGFSLGGENMPKGDSYAHLAESQIDAKLTSELREHPLHLLPRDERRSVLQGAYDERKITDMPPDWLWSGQLSSKNQKIFEALLTAYRGDLTRVLAHVRIERYSISRRYRIGAVTIGPQMAVDASERQITADRSLGALPASLSAVALFESMGELVDASSGVLEYSDLLKRPLDTWKYLLMAIETGEVSLNMSNMPLNTVMIGSSNELHLAAFKEHPEFNSFRGRLQLIRVPYLFDYEREKEIYDAQIVPQLNRHTSPHATYVMALWSVLTRLRPPETARYKSEKLGKLASELAPIEKAELLAAGTIPERLSADEKLELDHCISEIAHEFDAEPLYEGLTGISPREVRTLLFDAAQNARYACLNPLAVIERVEQFVDLNEFDFLKDTAERGYFEHRAFITQAKDRWLARVDDEFRTATGLIDETQYKDLFDRYVTHVSYWVKNERVYNRVTGKDEDPDIEMMTHVEKIISGGGEVTAFRKDLISAIAGFAIDSPGAKIDPSHVFPQHVKKLKEHYFAEKKGLLISMAHDLLALLREDKLPDERRERAERTRAVFETRFGYCTHCAKDVIGELLATRYAS